MASSMWPWTWPGAPGARTLRRFRQCRINASLLPKLKCAGEITIQLSGFDILQALIRAREKASRVGIVMYGQTLPELDPGW